MGCAAPPSRNEPAEYILSIISAGPIPIECFSLYSRVSWSQVDQVTIKRFYLYTESWIVGTMEIIPQNENIATDELTTSIGFLRIKIFFISGFK